MLFCILSWFVMENTNVLLLVIFNKKNWIELSIALSIQDKILTKENTENMRNNSYWLLLRKIVGHVYFKRAKISYNLSVFSFFSFCRLAFSTIFAVVVAIMFPGLFIRIDSSSVNKWGPKIGVSLFNLSISTTINYKGNLDRNIDWRYL